MNPLIVAIAFMVPPIGILLVPIYWLLVLLSAIKRPGSKTKSDRIEAALRRQEKQAAMMGSISSSTMGVIVSWIALFVTLLVVGAMVSAILPMQVAMTVGLIAGFVVLFWIQSVTRQPKSNEVVTD